MSASPVKTRRRWASVLICLAALAVGTHATRAQTGEAAEKRIEDEAAACLETQAGRTTSGMEECSARAYAAYDRILNEVYQVALGSVDPQSAEAIRASQRAWILYRDAKRAADRGAWASDRGSMVGPDLQAQEIDRIRQRIRELRYYGG